MTAMNPSVNNATVVALCGRSCAIPTMKAKSHHAVTSLTAAHGRAMAPSSESVMPRSERILDSTGNAVIDIATPMNKAKVVNGTALEETRGCKYNARIEPRTNGTTM